MRRVVMAACALALAGPALAQDQPAVSAVPSTSQGTAMQGAPVKRLLVDGYEVKAGFADATGGAYMVLQKATSAYLCHSNPTPTCEKLN